MRKNNAPFASMRLAAKGLLTMLSVAVVVLCGATAFAIDSAVINTRVFNDDPGSTLATTNNYPSLVQISDTPTGTGGFANLHNFLLADAGVEHAFLNSDQFSFATDLTISGPGNAEAGLLISPWWSQDVDGRLNFRTTDGEIAMFGGRLPFYSFTAQHGVTYTKGDTVHVAALYDPNSLTMQDPGTLQIWLTIGATTYTTGRLAFDEGNAAEGFGTWGILDDARAGGYLQVFTASSGAGNTVTATWGNMQFGVPEPATLSLVCLGVVGFAVRRRSH
jgi:hypothetical protein